jgi:hypothetical protein
MGDSDKLFNVGQFFNINSSKFLGGNNVHNLLIIGLLGFAVYKLK